MVDEDISGAIVFEVGDLQAVGVSYLLWLEGCIDGVYFYHCFGLLSLQETIKEMSVYLCEIQQIALYSNCRSDESCNFHS